MNDHEFYAAGSPCCLDGLGIQFEIWVVWI